MTQLPLVLALGAALLASACTHNLAVRQASDRVYADTSLKAAAGSAVQAIHEANLAVQSSDKPVDGMVVITARGTENALLRIEAPRLTLTLTEVAPSRVRVEATAILPGQSADFGMTDGMIRGVFRALDARLTPVVPAPAAQ